MRRLPLVVVLGLVLTASLLLPHSQTRADPRGVFVSPTTGVAVGSVWGVFIGVATYQQPDLNLTYPDADAKALHAFFVTQFEGRIPTDQFRLVLNEQATRGHILREVSEVLRLAQPEDLVILFLAIHGLPDASGNDLYFLSSNADANLPEDQGTSRDDLLKQIQRSKVRKALLLLLLDAYHASGFGASPAFLAMRNASAAEINRRLPEIGQAQDGIVVLSASSAAERSQEGPQFCGGHGAFTCALLTGLKGAADADGNGLVQMQELYDYTYQETKRNTKGYQNPEIQGRYDNGLPLAATGTRTTPPSHPPVAQPSVPAPEGQPYDELDKKRALAHARTQAWAKVQGYATDTSIPRKERLDALDQFLGYFVGEVEALKQRIQSEMPVVIVHSPSTPKEAGGEITGRDGAPMILVPAGEFRMGSNDGGGDEKPMHRVYLDDFYMDKFEVTTRRYAAFLQATEREKPDRWNEVIQLRDGDRPVIGVDWHDADAYCRYYGKRLPTEAEWEKAARGTDGRTYPWGNEEPSGRYVNFNKCCAWNGYAATLTAAGEYEAGRSPYGLYDMAGNVSEWVADWYDEDYYQRSPKRNPTGPSRGKTKVLRGGSWYAFATRVRSADRGLTHPEYRYYYNGFRCAKTPSVPYPLESLNP